MNPCLLEKIKNADAYLMDFDGTIIDSNDHWDRVFTEACAPCPPDVRQAASCMTARQVAPVFAPYHHTTSEAFYNDLTERTHAHYAQAALTEGVETFICANQHRICIATMGDRDHVQRVLVNRCLNVPLVTCDDVGHGKPHPGVYLEAARRMGVPPERCVAFEDSLVGVASARAAGVGVVIGVCAWIGDDYQTAIAQQCDATILNYNELI